MRYHTLYFKMFIVLADFTQPEAKYVFSTHLVKEASIQNSFHYKLVSEEKIRYIYRGPQEGGPCCSHPPAVPSLLDNRDHIMAPQSHDHKIVTPVSVALPCQLPCCWISHGQASKSGGQPPCNSQKEMKGLHTTAARIWILEQRIWA